MRTINNKRIIDIKDIYGNNIKYLDITSKNTYNISGKFIYEIKINDILIYEERILHVNKIVYNDSNKNIFDASVTFIGKLSESFDKLKKKESYNNDDFYDKCMIRYSKSLNKM